MLGSAFRLFTHLLKIKQRPVIREEVRCIQHLNSGNVFAVEWCYVTGAAGRRRVIRVEPEAQVINLNRGGSAGWSWHYR